MITIYKYPLSAKTVNYLDLPKGAKIISTEPQRGGVNIYALVDTEQTEEETFEVLLYGTGHNVTPRIDEYTFVGTVSLHDGDLVFHIFYQKVESQS